jgi:hypothetical protein
MRSAVTVFLTVSVDSNWEPIPSNATDRTRREKRQTESQAVQNRGRKSLYLVVAPSGSKLWRFDYRYGQMRKTLAFGKWDDVELAQARDRRDAARKKLVEGIDPGAPPETMFDNNPYNINSL